MFLCVYVLIVLCLFLHHSFACVYYGPLAWRPVCFARLVLYHVFVVLCLLLHPDFEFIIMLVFIMALTPTLPGSHCVCCLSSQSAVQSKVGQCPTRTCFKYYVLGIAQIQHSAFHNINQNAINKA